MKKEAYFATAEELARGGLETIPPQMISGKHLIYADRGTGMLRKKYFSYQLHAGVQ